MVELERQAIIADKTILPKTVFAIVRYNIFRQPGICTVVRQTFSGNYNPATITRTITNNSVGFYSLFVQLFRKRYPETIGKPF